MEVERGLGFEPVDKEAEKLGYDIESRIPDTGRLRFIEVKGRIAGAATITVTRNEILYSLNKPDDFILAIVEFHNEHSHTVHYVRRPFQLENPWKEESGRPWVRSRLFNFLKENAERGQRQQKVARNRRPHAPK